MTARSIDPLTPEEEDELRAWGGHGEPPLLERIWATLDAARASASTPDGPDAGRHPECDRCGECYWKGCTEHEDADRASDTEGDTDA